ncbi:Cystatin-12 [Heterocephalus glaber]|uniref:Cystatin-12 n=1 Tax=Heterocephalus glaber TaxID=10181 RepID=G5CBD4_HETGA|nr:cystatin-12 [Heterocephalus glaber]XP_004840973.1 cystatin-12 [Heterocephalus glaber]EHB18845.1 Cystatin-12 [Heterocephalus glaber]
MLWKVTLLVGFLVLGTPDQFVDIDKNGKAFAISVEHVVFHFNEAQEDPFAYKFLRVWQSQGEFFTGTYLIDLEMGRTVCRKHDEDIDNCLLQQDTGRRKVRCTYIVKTIEWLTKFSILNSTCAQTEVERAWLAL